MDAGSLALLIPIVAIASGAMVKIAKVKAAADTRGMADAGLADRVAALEEEVTTLRQEMSETHERLDFTERLLSQARNDRLAPPPPA